MYRDNLKSIRAHTHGDEGAAMVIVLTIIFVMTTLGGIALLATLTNLRMSAKYTNWTAAYYELDMAAERKLSLLDARLSQAEGYAYEYMRQECYRLADEVPAITGDVATDVNEKAQDFIHGAWFGDVYTPSLSEVSEGGAVVIDEARYNTLFARFNAEFYQRLYYFFSYRLVANDVRAGLFESVGLSPMMSGYAGMLDDYEHDPDGMKVVFGVSDGMEEYARHVTVSVNVTAPVFGHETRTEDIPFKANPVWSGALTARGSLRFDGAASGEGGPVSGVTRVYGDIYAIDYNEYFINQNDWASLEGNEYGVASAGAVVEIYGNVYSRGDLHVIGDGGGITVRRYADGFYADYKKDMYGNTLYFDTSSVPVPIQRFTQPEGAAWNRVFIPFFYRDHLGGNVYCNNLAIADDIDGGYIVIDNGPVRGGGYDGMTGVAWTFDDVQNNGTNSRISIGGNLIGVSSNAAFDDHTDSSAVKNLHYENSVIELAGAVIIPGVSFMRFNGVNDLMDEDTFFETAESASASNTAIVNTYMEKPASDPGVLYFYDRYALRTERGMSNFFLVRYEALGDKARHLVGNLSGRVPDTGIVTGESLEGYTRGAVIARDASGTKRMFGPPGFGDIADYGVIVNYSDNYLAYTEIKDSLETAYRLKTQSFGVAGYKFGDFIKLSAILDPSGRLYPSLEGAITFLHGDSAYELDGDRSGIVYCASAMDGSLPVLTIRGDGNFRGTIISEGDIHIEGAPTFHYDEKLITKILLRYPEIRDFFSPGEMGETSFVRVMSVTQGLKKLVKERYKVSDWKQWQE